MDIAGLDKAELLRRLYNHAKPMGMGMLHADSAEMTREEAAGLLLHGSYFDYVKGRPLKVKLMGEDLSTGLYNRDQGDGAAERIIQGMRDEAE